ncbi:polysaccharide deacetylase family protein [Roseateles sp. SL47]|uniref:polysaccharide deacetylase family protein n=1 Tax=Roseateles sp. SL47 TaxID=2995138 RepID=UPI002272098C|nr:polysaccharide deacetylase family protein [Roseateles sp. SL47]WAC75687.1 polysaccharide deacetylase family protein [Roseateles sp. SL47]
MIALLVCGTAQAAKSIAITIDDVPISSKTPYSVSDAASVNSKLLAALQKHHATAVGFVNEDRLLVRGQVDAGIDLLDQWLIAGMELGNHNFGHVGLWKSTLQENQDAVVKGETITRWLTATRGKPLRYYRHPFTQTGRNAEEKQAFEDFLSARGYTVAPFTIEHDDYLYACVYDKLTLNQDEERTSAVIENYLAHLEVSVRVYESMSDQLFGRQIPQILLIHATRLNADALDAMLMKLEDMGYRFVSLETALLDAAYQTPTKESRQFGPSWLARWARAMPKKLTVYGQPDPKDATADMALKLCAN